jgi:hypothetical protein
MPWDMAQHKRALHRVTLASGPGVFGVEEGAVGAHI